MERMTGLLIFNVGTTRGRDRSLGKTEKEVTVTLGLDILFRVLPAALTQGEKLLRLVT